MRRSISTAGLCALEAVALLVISCGAPTQSQQSLSLRSDDQIENSGRRLSGDWVLSAVEDAYAEKNTRGQSIFSFDENGNFKRQDKSRIEEGVYLIGTKGELVIYIEKVNGDSLGEARSEHYMIVEQRDDAITLQSPRSRKIVLQKRL
jgi:hypothetical protein